MYRELINCLTYMHGQICKGKGIIKDEELREMANGAHSLTRNSPTIAHEYGLKEKDNDLVYLKEAREIDKQIEEITNFLLSLEIV